MIQIHHGDDRMRWNRWIFLWSPIVVGFIGIAALQIHLNQRYQSQWMVYHTEQQRLEILDRKTVDHAQAIYQKLFSDHKGDPPLLKAEQALNGGQPFAMEDYGGETMLRYVDDATGGQAWLTFRDQLWTGVRSVPDYRRGLLKPDPNGGLCGTITIGRRLAYILGYIIWVFLFIGFFIGFRTIMSAHRIYKAFTLLGIATLSTFLAFLGPQYWRAWDDFFEDDAPGLGFVAIGLSSLVLISAYRRHHGFDPTPRCAGCGYNLTGNISGVCPECGKPIVNSKAELEEI